MAESENNLPVSVSPAIETGIFSELFGFVMTDPLALERFHHRSVIGANLLDSYTQTDEGEKVSEAGAAIPILGVEAGYYSVTFRNFSDESKLLTKPIATSTGWLLNVVSGSVAVCGIGYLANWNPQHEAVRHFNIPKGWYSVEIHLGASINDDDFLLEIILSPSSGKPEFTANMDKTLLEND